MNQPTQSALPVAAGLLQEYSRPENSDTPMMAKISDTICVSKYTFTTSVKEDIRDDTTTRMLALPRMTRRGRSARPSRKTRRKRTLPLLDSTSTTEAAGERTQ